MLRFLAGALIIGSAVIILLSLYTFYLYTHPRRYITSVTPQDLNLNFEDLSLTTSDGIDLAAWLIPNKDSDAVIIVCHGYPADKGDVLQFASFLKDDYNLFFFDFRCMGKSGGTYSTIGDKERLDLAAAITYLKKRGFNKIGAFGFSMGGAVIIMVNSPDIKAAVTDSAFANLESLVHTAYGNLGWLRFPFVFFTKVHSRLFLNLDIKSVSSLKSMKELKFPILLIHAESDEIVSVDNALLLHSANPESALWIIPGALHGQTYSIMPEEYENKILSFFKTHL
ncbi:MAG: alpha/beta hydrolase [Candidatus Omnitrophica bacterium]|nr:alpha/beta hydrolase [Candidatus Omnitrophota bacterium]